MSRRDLVDRYLDLLRAEKHVATARGKLVLLTGFVVGALAHFAFDWKAVALVAVGTFAALVFEWQRFDRRGERLVREHELAQRELRDRGHR